jgi:hypothetical protein
MPNDRDGPPLFGNGLAMFLRPEVVHSQSRLVAIRTRTDWHSFASFASFAVNLVFSVPLAAEASRHPGIPHKNQEKSLVRTV